MIGHFASVDRTDDQGVVRRPLPSDALGGALRGIYGGEVEVPADMRHLLSRLDRPMRGH